MREEDHRLVWLGMGVYALTWLVGSALLSLVWGIPAGIWSAVAGLSALAVVGLLAQPFRLFGTLWIRLTRTINLSEIVGSTAPPSTFRRFVARGVSIEPQDGQLSFDGIALKHPKGSTLTVSPKTDTKPGLTVQTAIKVEGGDSPAARIVIDVHPRQQPALYWALWSVCRAKGWDLKAPLGSLSPDQADKPLTERIHNQLGWLKGARLDEDVDPSEHKASEGGPIPLATAINDGISTFEFPDGALDGEPDPTAYNAARESKLQVLTVACMMGVLTMPLAVVMHYIRVTRYKPRMRSLTLSAEGITLDNHTEPHASLEWFTAIPVHSGPPIVMTRQNAAFIGGIESYEDRVAFGTFVLEQIAAHLGDARLEAKDTQTAAPWTAPPAPERPPEAKWRNNITGTKVFSAAVGLFLGYMVFEGMMDFWEPWWILAHTGMILSFSPANMPWVYCCMLATALIPCVFLATKTKGVWRWPVLLQATIPALVLASLASSQGGSLDALSGDHLESFSPSHVKISHKNLDELGHVGKNFDNLDLRYIDFTNADLRGASFFSAKLQGVSFAGADLEGANFFNARLEGAVFVNAKLKGAVFSYAHLDRASLLKIDAPESVWDYAVLSDSNFSGANLQGANFRNGMIDSADFSNTNLEGADLRYAWVSYTKFTRSNLKSASMAGLNGVMVVFQQANLDGAIFSGATIQPLPSTVPGFSDTTLCPDRTLQKDTPNCGWTFNTP